MPKPTNPTPPHPVTFGLNAAHFKRYQYDRAIAAQDGRKLPLAAWLNGCVSDALAARSEAMADAAAVAVAVANFADAFGLTPKSEEE